jgi:hypothetical protein
MVSEFEDKQALIEALLTTSHLPLYSNGHVARRFQGAWHFDGGVRQFLPNVPKLDYTVRVCCFPSQNINLVRGCWRAVQLLA